jgi:hypothetical protein
MARQLTVQNYNLVFLQFCWELLVQLILEKRTRSHVVAVLLGAGGETGRHPEQHEDSGQEPGGHRQEEKEGPGGAGSQQVSLFLEHFCRTAITPLIKKRGKEIVLCHSFLRKGFKAFPVTR